MDEELYKKIVSKLRECEDVKLSSFRAEREHINGKQEGYEEAMFQARGIIADFIKRSDTKQ